MFLYGALAGGRTRAELRGRPELARSSGELAPDAGPPRLHPTAGAVLVAARPPLAAFNVEIDAHARDRPRRSRPRSAGRPEGCPACGRSACSSPAPGIVQVSTNIEDLTRTTPGDVVARRRAPRDRRPAPSSSRPRPRAARSNPSRRRPAARRARCSDSSGATLQAPMAQTKRKRRSKHRGNAAGVVEARGRTGRRPTDGGAEEGRRARPRASARLNKPPTWNSAFLKAGADGRACCSSSRRSACSAATRRSRSRSSSALFALLLYTPLAYATDKFVYQRAQQRKQQQKPR